jgi:Peptidase family M50.
MMNFSFLNIPVVIQPSFWLFLCFFCYNPGSSLTQMAILALVFGFSLLFHEYGHALAAKKMGQSPDITLESVGGYVSYQSRGLSEKQQFIVTFCGPLFTALLIAASYYLLYDDLFSSWAIRYFLYCTMKLNTYWLIVNLAPLSPLDGGKMAEFFLKKIFREERGRYLSLLLGNIVAVAGVAYFVFA